MSKCLITEYPKGFTLSEKQQPKDLEDERKYRVVLGPDIEDDLSSDELFEERANRLLDIFNRVVENNAYFKKMHKSQKAENFSARVKQFLKLPIEFSLSRTRYYSNDVKLTGVDPKTGKAETEFRSEERSDKGRWKHTIKTSVNGNSEGGTLSRGEYEEFMDGPIHNFSAHSSITDHLRGIFGLESNLRKLSKIDGQSTKILYHPDGNEDVVLEIKFDIQEGMTFDGFVWPIIEVEVEIKSSKCDLSKDEKEALLQRSEDVLYRHYEDNLERVTTSKNAAGNIHLSELRDSHPDWFRKTFETLPYDRFERRDGPVLGAP